MSKKIDPKAPVCDFCGNIIEHPNIAMSSYSKRLEESVVICSNCVDELKEANKDEKREDFDERYGIYTERLKWLTPKGIVKYLDQHVIGQQHTKKVLAVALYDHFIRVSKEYTNMKKSNILLLGPTGSGKTLLLSKLAEYLNIPFVSIDTSNLTSSGYVGKDIDSILIDLIIDSGYDIFTAERGIIYLDEIDKICTSGSSDREVFNFGREVQNQLLKMIEGHTFTPSSKNCDMVDRTIDTTDILFICGGAFSGIEKIVEKRTNGNSNIGFGLEVKSKNEVDFTEIYSKVIPEDIRKYGFSPEFVGRLPILTYTSELTEKDLIKVLTSPTDSIIKEFKTKFKEQGVDLHFTAGALEAIAHKAYINKTGARGLRSIIENIMLDLSYEIPDRKDISKCIIDKAVILNDKKPIYNYCSVNKKRSVNR